MGGTVTNFSSNSAVCMFLLTPPIHNKHEHKSCGNKTTVAQVSVQRLKTSCNESVGYRESSLSQQEVLLAKDGSKKLSQLLADDKLWGDTPL